MARPIAYSKAFHQRLVAAARQTTTLTGAARGCGIDYSRLRYWMQKHPELRADMEAAIELGWEDRANLASDAVKVHFERFLADPKYRLDSRLIEMSLKRHDGRFRDGATASSESGTNSDLLRDIHESLKGG